MSYIQSDSPKPPQITIPIEQKSDLSCERIFSGNSSFVEQDLLLCLSDFEGFGKRFNGNITTSNVEASGTSTTVTGPSALGTSTTTT